MGISPGLTPRQDYHSKNVKLKEMMIEILESLNLQAWNTCVALSRWVYFWTTNESEQQKVLLWSDITHTGMDNDGETIEATLPLRKWTKTKKK